MGKVNEFEVLEGDCRELLPMLPSDHVQSVITSPPYWGLRKYGDDPRELGSEKSFNEYIEKMTQVFEEVRRVLRPDGTLWLNMGDSYACKPGNGAGNVKQVGGGVPHHSGMNTTGKGFKTKDLIGQPWALAFALRAAGWYLRQDIIWFKKNPMPESCTDRPTRAHEYFFLLSKSERYYYDHEAIKEKGNGSTEKRVNQANFANQKGGAKETGTGNRSNRKVLSNLKKRIPSGWDPGPGNHQAKVGRYRKESPNSGMFKSHQPGKENSKPGRKVFEMEMRSSAAERMGRVPGWRKLLQPEMRNKRSVWELATIPFKEAHYATFPPGLVLPAVLAGSRPGDLVMDPFSGAGTVGKVCSERGRSYIGIELYEKNTAITDRRMAQVQPGLVFREEE